MKYLFSTLITISISFTNFSQSNDFRKQQTSVLKTIEIINDVRMNPDKNYKMFVTFNISSYKISKTQLIYDKRLSKECYEYAKYLAENNVFKHSYIRGTCESLTYGGDFITTVFDFINEIGAEEGEDGHRKHMLGSPPFHKEKYIGVGFYRSKRGILYCCIRTREYKTPYFLNTYF